MISDLMMASGVYDPSHVFPEAMKSHGAVSVCVCVSMGKGESVCMIHHMCSPKL